MTSFRRPWGLIPRVKKNLFEDPLTILLAISRVYRERRNRQGYHRFQLLFWSEHPKITTPQKRLIPPKALLFGALGGRLPIEETTTPCIYHGQLDATSFVI